MNPGYSEYISVGKFSVGFYWGWYVCEWVKVPGPWNDLEKYTYSWARWFDACNPAPFSRFPEPNVVKFDAKFDRYCKSSNLITRDLFRQLTGVEICKWDVYHSEAA